jgi:hypothetical protein
MVCQHSHPPARHNHTPHPDPPYLGLLRTIRRFSFTRQVILLAATRTPQSSLLMLPYPPLASLAAALISMSFVPDAAD